MQHMCARLALIIVAVCTLANAADAPSATVAYFTNTRNVKSSDKTKQNYVVLDADVFIHSRADLADLRFYAGTTEVPYAIVIKRGSSETELSTIPILNKGKFGTDTRFNVDVGIPEYDNIRIDISAKDFIAQAKLEGANENDARQWTDLGTFTIFDFTKERLGSNFTLRLHSPSRFRFLRITITGPITPDEFTAASVANVQESKARYVALPETPMKTADGRKTVYEWDAPERVPLDRIQFDVDTTEVNFNRTLAVECDKRRINTYDLSRIHLVRKGRKIDSEELAPEVYGLECKHYRLEIDNGDDQPLRITAIHPQMIERRAYFDPRGNDSLKLYYGDEKLERPQYDYTKLFAEPEMKDVAQALLATDEHNAAFTGRPDERPWSEKHPAVLWIAMIAAIGLLGTWALKGFKS